MATNGKKERVQLSQGELLVLCHLVLVNLRPQIEAQEVDPELARLLAKLTNAWVRRAELQPAAAAALPGSERPQT